MLTASHTRGVLLLGRPQLVALPRGTTSLVRPVLGLRAGGPAPLGLVGLLAGPLAILYQLSPTLLLSIT